MIRTVIVRVEADFDLFESFWCPITSKLNLLFVYVLATTPPPKIIRSRNSWLNIKQMINKLKVLLLNLELLLLSKSSIQSPWTLRRLRTQTTAV